MPKGNPAGCACPSKKARISHRRIPSDGSTTIIRDSTRLGKEVWYMPRVSMGDVFENKMGYRRRMVIHFLSEKRVQYSISYKEKDQWEKYGIGFFNTCTEAHLKQWGKYLGNIKNDNNLWKQKRRDDQSTNTNRLNSHSAACFDRKTCKS